MNSGDFGASVRGMVMSVLAAVLMGSAQGKGFQAAWEYAKARGANAVVVMVDGKTVFGEGAVGNSNQILASGTKSLTGTAMACAVQDKLFTGWDEKLEVAFPEWKDDARGDVTYRQLLGLCSGLDVSDRETFQCPSEEEMLATKLVRAPGKRFEYGSRPFNLFSLALERKLKGEKIQDYLDRRVLKKIGCAISYKNINEDGRVQIAGMGRCAPEDWVKLGELWRNNGKFKGEQLWDEKTFAEVAKKNGPGAQYGLSFWLSPDGNPRTGGGKDSDFKGLFLAAGAGLQLNIVVPTERAVVVRTGMPKGEAGEFDGNEFLKLMFKG